jgi:hypothetical protein
MKADTDDGGDSAPITDLVSAFSLALLAIFTLVWLIPNHTDAAAANYDVSPAFIPKVSAYGVLALSLVQFALALRRRGLAAGHVTRGMCQWHNVLDPLAWAFICTSIYFGITFLGFLIAGPIILGLCLFAAGQRSWIVFTIMALGFPALLKFAAWQIFTVNLP